MATQGLFAILVLLSRPDLDPRPDFPTLATPSACPAVSQDRQRLIWLGHGNCGRSAALFSWSAVGVL